MDQRLLVIPIAVLGGCDASLASGASRPSAATCADCPTLPAYRDAGQVDSMARPSPPSAADAGASTAEDAPRLGSAADAALGDDAPSTPDAGGPSPASDSAIDPVATRPGDVFDLTHWTLQLPIETDRRGTPDEVFQPELDAFLLAPFVSIDPSGGLRLAANAGGVTTTNSRFARTELREMTNGGVDRAAWSTTVGRHVLTVRGAAVEQPDETPNMVLAQIHGGDAYLVLVRLDGQRMWVKHQDADAGALDESYVVGTPYTIGIEAEGGVVRVSYNGEERVQVTRAHSGCYFKTGAYLQTNTSADYGDEPDALGAVVLYDVQLLHE